MAQSTYQVKPPAVACFGQYLYEYRKGVRQLFMLTMSPNEAQGMKKRLERESIDCHIQEICPTKVNLYFGRTSCVEVVRAIVNKPLYELTSEEDFILGTLLGYDIQQQCLRFLTRTGRQSQERMVIH
ncbi:DUF2023 family protein [Azomonas macrocytogenes]|uniref:DUF2023 domain-containing protein n=1 Tax=Azomonas macrocytogenes TaxID=69962 RepID=A0A839T8B3_AZOMA|nr:DUF2023 family protein [Azomonas macrocytogenes]MBB3104215.1 hypothetical protein [Azomonas macrocytogenes]